MKKFSNQQIQKLLTEIDKSTISFLASHVGKDILTKEDVSFLKQNGIDVNKLGNEGDTPIQQAFKFGIIAEAMGDSRANKMSYKQFEDFVTSGKFIKLTTAEQEALNYIKNRAYNDIKGLGNKVNNKTGKVLIEGSFKKRLKLENLIRDKAAEAIENRKSIKELATELATISKDTKRDFERIADYIMHEAYSHGRVMSMLKQGNVDDIKVYFLVSKNACKDCIKMYLNPNGEPKVFPLETIINNGTNIGRKQSEIKPTIPPLHPRCRCNIMQVRNGMKFDNKTGAFTKVDENQRNVLKERGVSVKVTIKRS